MSPNSEKPWIRIFYKDISKEVHSWILSFIRIAGKQKQADLNEIIE